MMLEEPPGFEDQSGFTVSEATSGYNSTFFQALTYDRELGATRGIDAVLKRHRLDALVVPVVGLVTSASGLYPDIQS
ncbi:hypothetical protein BDQ12DRAFT_694329 [Crucibulum laeve]|uniref:Uncharacterized protein n=1 Tax=Crucibulum laeve TaxID=68775 RepID=A0A5C3LE00_9AGAR|nr:hypothetical protein BDQ12DRAFT_694329 [Crucibulum laeve]